MQNKERREEFNVAEGLALDVNVVPFHFERSIGDKSDDIAGQDSTFTFCWIRHCNDIIRKTKF